MGYEYMDRDPYTFGGEPDLDPAHGLISRIRLNYRSGIWKGFDALVQAQYVGPIVREYSPYDDSKNKIADREAFRFHQAFLGWQGFDTVAKIGAQEIKLDNERLIGNVGWRFNAQSFNAAMLANRSIENLALYYAYADSVNGADGETNEDRHYHLLNGEYHFGKKNHASLFAYFQRNDGPDPFDALNEIDTYGLRIWGDNDAWHHDAMLAFQRQAYYGMLTLGMKVRENAKIQVGFEYLSGGDKNKERFLTLNGTAHKFNGWADQFTGSNGDNSSGFGSALGSGLYAGLADSWVRADYSPAEKWELTGVYHFFHTGFEQVIGYYHGLLGQELDFAANYQVNSHFKAEAAIAAYFEGDSDDLNYTTDKTVFWLRGTWGF